MLSVLDNHAVKQQSALFGNTACYFSKSVVLKVDVILLQFNLM